MKIHSLKTSLLAAAVAALFATTAVRAADATENRGQLSSSDYKFTCEAAHGGAAEVAMGQLAVQKSTDTSIQQFGQRMVTDHGKINKDLTDLATQKGATLPTEPSSTEQKHIDKLNSLSGAEFDKEYVSMMIDMHKKDLKAFKHEAEKADDAELRTFASNTATMIDDHLKSIEDIKANMKSTVSAENK